jgi:hypothetical protein
MSKRPAETFDDLSQEEFDAMMDAFIEREEEELDLPTFLELAAARDRVRPPTTLLRLDVRFVDQDLVVIGPDGQPLPGNRLRIGDTEIEIALT